MKSLISSKEAKKLGAEKQCCLTIAYGATGPKEEPFEEMNE